MAIFPANPKRVDPYKNFKFRLKWDGRYVAGVSKVGSLKRTTEVVEHRSGGDPSTSHKSPGRTKYEAITLERGLTQDLAFHDWAGLVWNFGSGLGSEVSLANFRKDIYLEFYNEAGQLVETRTFFQYTAAHEFGRLLGLPHPHCKGNADQCYGVTPAEAMDVMGLGALVTKRDYAPFQKIMKIYGEGRFLGPCNDWKLVGVG